MKHLLSILVLGGTSSLMATPPAWWTTGDTAIIQPGATPSNGSPATAGQLKNVAQKAALYLNNTLPAPGAGAAVNNLVAGFQRNEGDLSPISLGQLKFVAKPFYDRLRDVGYNTKQNLINHGAPGWAYDYPWDPATPTSSGLLLANLGQMKWVFSFDLTGFTVVDANGNGLPDPWEQKYYPSGVPVGYDPRLADGDQDGISDWIEYLWGTSPLSADSDGDGLSDTVDPEPLTFTPAPPANFRVEVSTPAQSPSDNWNYADYWTSITLKWSPSPGATGYRLERCSDLADWTTIFQGAGNEFPDQNLLSHDHYLYRLTAYRAENGLKSEAPPGYVSYEVPTSGFIYGKGEYCSPWNGAFKDYVNQGSASTYYLTERTYRKTVSTADSTEIRDVTETRQPATWGATFNGAYSFDQNHTYYNSTYVGGTTVKHNTATYRYQRTKFSKANLVDVTDAAQTDTISESETRFDYNGITSSSSSSGTKKGTYLKNNIYTPTAGAGVHWEGTYFSNYTGTFSYSGNSSWKVQITTTGSTSPNQDLSSTLGANGVWSPSPPWDGRLGDWTGNFFADITGTTATRIDYAKASTGFTGFRELSNPYTTAQFLADAIANFSDEPANYTLKNGSDLASYWSLSNLCSKYFDADFQKVTLVQTKYLVRTSPSLPFRLTWLELFVPDAIYAQNATPRDLEVYKVGELNLTAQVKNTSPSALFVTDALARSEPGQDWLLNPQVSFVAVKDPNNSSNDNAPIEDNKYPVVSDGSAPAGFMWMLGAGKRIFPDAKTPSDTTPRDKVDVNVSVGLPHINVYLKVLDVDDPTPDKYDVDPLTSQHVVDPTDNGGEKGGDNTGTAAAFVSSGSDTVDCVTDEWGIARVGADLPRLKVSMRAGDNYRVAVAFKKADLGALQVTSKSGSGYVPASGEGVSGFKGGISPLLTVWRKLYLEVDSMTAVATSGDEKNFEQGTVQVVTGGAGQSTVTLNILLTGPADRYQNGYLTIGKTRYEVISNTDNYVYNDSVTVRGTVPSSSVNQSFTITDDDDKYLPELGLPAPLPRDGFHADIVHGIAPKFAPAYIQIEDANAKGWNGHPTLPFKLNASTAAGTDIENLTTIDLQTKPTFWCHTLVVAYQPIAATDWDPISEPIAYGVTPANGFTNQSDPISIVFIESIREASIPSHLEPVVLNAPTNRKDFMESYYSHLFGITSHECGHVPGRKNGDDDHLEGQLMSAGVQSMVDDFSPSTIFRFRKSESWRD